MPSTSEACRSAAFRPAIVDVETYIGTFGCSWRRRIISGMADAISPTETACNQIEAGFVRVKDRGRNPKRSPKWDLYSRWVAILAQKYRTIKGNSAIWIRR